MKPQFNIYITEKLRREIETEAETEQDALDNAEQLYNDSTIVLDYSDIIDTEFSSVPMSKSAINTLNEVHQCCEVCPNNTSCIEDACVLFRIEKGVMNNEV